MLGKTSLALAIGSLVSLPVVGGNVRLVFTRQIEGGHNEAKRDELQHDPPAHHSLAGVRAASRNHVPHAKQKYCPDRRERDQDRVRDERGRVTWYRRL